MGTDFFFFHDTC